MAFRRSDLQEAFFVPGTHPFRVWGYGTADPLEAVLAPGYFALARALWSSPSERHRAQALAHEAVKLYRRAGGAYLHEAEKVEGWLAKPGPLAAR